jgi:hypothetical protein
LSKYNTRISDKALRSIRVKPQAPSAQQHTDPTLAWAVDTLDSSRRTFENQEASTKTRLKAGERGHQEPNVLIDRLGYEAFIDGHDMTELRKVATPSPLETDPPFVSRLITFAKGTFASKIRQLNKQPPRYVGLYREISRVCTLENSTHPSAMFGNLQDDKTLTAYMDNWLSFILLTVRTRSQTTAAAERLWEQLHLAAIPNEARAEVHLYHRKDDGLLDGLSPKAACDALVQFFEQADSADGGEGEGAAEAPMRLLMTLSLTIMEQKLRGSFENPLLATAVVLCIHPSKPAWMKAQHYGKVLSGLLWMGKAAIVWWGDQRMEHAPPRFAELGTTIQDLVIDYLKVWYTEWDDVASPMRKLHSIRNTTIRSVKEAGGSSIPIAYGKDDTTLIVNDIYVVSNFAPYKPPHRPPGKGAILTRKGWRHR